MYWQKYILIDTKCDCWRTFLPQKEVEKSVLYALLIAKTLEICNIFLSKFPFLLIKLSFLFKRKNTSGWARRWQRTGAITQWGSLTAVITTIRQSPQRRRNLPNREVRAERGPEARHWRRAARGPATASERTCGRWVIGPSLWQSSHGTPSGVEQS